MSHYLEDNKLSGLLVFTKTHINGLEESKELNLLNYLLQSEDQQSCNNQLIY